VKVKIKPKGKNIELGNFVGKSWTEGFREFGCDEVIIEGDNGDAILLDWNMPYVRYDNEEDEKKWNEYIAKRKKEGWRWSASWGYGFFKLIKEKP